MPINPTHAYLKAKIDAATPAELTLMLYNGAIKFCNLGIKAIDEKEIVNAHNYIKRTEKIINELQATLNDDYETAKDFHNVYEYIQELLTWANVKKDKELLTRARKVITEMRDTWVQVIEIVKNS